MAGTTRTDQGRVRIGVQKTITGYMQPMRSTDDRVSKAGNRMVRRTIRVPVKDHPKGGTYHDVQSVDPRIAEQLAAVPARALVQAWGSAKTDEWTTREGEVRVGEIVWCDGIDVIELDNRQPAPPAGDDIPY